MTALELQVQADARAPGRVRAELRRWLAEHEWPEEEGEDLVLAVSEAVSNSAEHAYTTERSAPEHDGLVAVVVTELPDADRRRAKAVVDDFGVWRASPSDKGFRGHGLPLIGTLMDSYDVDHRNTGTRVTIVSPPVTAVAANGASAPHGLPDRSAEERLRWLEAVSDAGLAQLTVDRLLDELLDKVRELMAVDTAAVLLLDPVPAVPPRHGGPGHRGGGPPGRADPARPRLRGPHRRRNGTGSRSTRSITTTCSTRSCARRGSPHCSACRWWPAERCSACCTSAR